MPRSVIVADGENSGNELIVLVGASLEFRPLKRVAIRGLGTGGDFRRGFRAEYGLSDGFGKSPLENDLGEHSKGWAIDGMAEKRVGGFMAQIIISETEKELFFVPAGILFNRDRIDTEGHVHLCLVVREFNDGEG